MELKTYKLSADRISSQSYREIKSFGRRGDVVENGTVIIEGVTFAFIDETLDDGTEVVFWLGNWGYCYKKSDLDEYKAIRERQLKQEEFERKKLSNKRRKQANAFYEAYDVPFKFHINIKDVLSGLTENSMGNGTKKNTVYHVILDEDFTQGRLKRSSGEFLCSQPKIASNWGNGRGDQTWHTDSDGTEYVPQVNCKACLKILERFKK